MQVSCGEDDEDLKAALRLSLDLNAPSTGPSLFQRPTPTVPLPGGGGVPAAPVAPAAAAATSGDKMQMQSRVKELFTLYRAQGVAPNEAASRAVEEARRQERGGANP